MLPMARNPQHVKLSLPRIEVKYGVQVLLVVHRMCLSSPGIPAFEACHKSSRNSRVVNSTATAGSSSSTSSPLHDKSCASSSHATSQLCIRTSASSQLWRALEDLLIRQTENTGQILFLENLRKLNAITSKQNQKHVGIWMCVGCLKRLPMVLKC